MNSRELKETILKTLAYDGIGEGGSPAPRRAHKMNLIGRPYQAGDLESALNTSFTPELRASAAKAFEELKRDEFIVPTYDDLADPENWVVITDKGMDYLTAGLPQEANTKEVTVPNLTLDTNCVINLFDHGAPTPTSVEALSEIFRYSLSGKANVAVTTRVEADLLGDNNPERLAQMLRTLALFPVIGTIGRWDTSKWDGGDMWGDENSTKLTNEIQGILFPGLTNSDRHHKNKLMDIDHLVGHVINGRDVFVTDDTDMLKKKEVLSKSPGIIVMSPTECVTYLEEIAVD